MKKSLYLSVFALLCLFVICPTFADALHYNFIYTSDDPIDADYVGRFLAGMDVSIENKKMTLTLENLSPAMFNGSANAPFIKGFGLQLTSVPGIESWTLKAYDNAADSGNKDKLKVIAYRNATDYDNDYWKRTVNTNLDLNLFFKATFSQKLLYNPDASVSDIFAAYTDAELEINFMDTPEINGKKSPYVVMTIGAMNDFNLQGQSVAASEPGTLLLLGLGLIGIAAVMRELL